MSKLPALISQKQIVDNRMYRQIDISRATGIDPNKISRLLTGHTKIEHVTVETASRLARFLGCKIDDLYEVSDEEKAS